MKVWERYRILHLIHSCQRRGAETFATHLAQHISLEKFENALCSLYVSDNGLSEKVPLFEIRARGSKLENVMGFQPGVLKGLLTVYRQFRPHAICAHGSSTLKYAVLSKLFYRTPLIVYRNIGKASAWFNSRWKVSLYKVLLRQINAVVSLSQQGQRDFLRLFGFPLERVVTIRNAVDIEPYQNLDDRLEKRQSLGLEGEDIVIITVGSMAWEKNQGELIRLLAEIRENNIAGQLLLVGDGPLQADLKQQAEQLNLSAHVHFLGVIDDVPQLLAAADIFVLPSLTEGMPAALIEAGLAGLPAVAYDVGGVGEVIKHNVTGLLVKPRDSTGFKESVLHLLDSPEARQKMGEAARRLYREKFDIRAIAKDYERLFLKLLSDQRGIANGG